MMFLEAILALTQRDLLRFVRQRSRLIGAVVTPLLFWLLLGLGFGKFFQDPNSSQGYLHFFFPGMLTLSVLFTAIFSTMSVIEDRHEGFLQGVLVAPLPKWVFLVAKLLSGAILGLGQGALLLLAAPLMGVSLGLFAYLSIFLILFLIAMALTCLGFFLAWKIDSVSGYHSMMNILLMPMWLLSGAVFPVIGRGEVMNWLAHLNPMSYAVRSIRSFISSGVDPHLATNAGILFLFMLLFCVPTQMSLDYSERGG